MVFGRTLWLALLLAVCAHAAERTGISGTVVDADTGEPIAGASVQLVGGQDVVTDASGRFVIETHPGRHALVAMADYHRPVRIRNLTVDSGSLTAVRVRLPPDADAVEVVYVEARADKRKESVLLEQRKRSGGVSDAIGAQEISRAADSSAGEALKRVVSASIVDGKYVTIRGLGGRYTTTLLNGAALPSPDPDDGAVPLDLFPAALLSNLNVAKSYSPELPGAFGGGAVQIETSVYPERFEAKTKLGLGFESASAFRDMPSHPTGALDALGWDDGSRALPDGLPDDRPLTDDAGLSAAFLERAGEAFPGDWAPTSRMAWPALSVGATVGDTLALGGGKLGLLGALTYGHTDRLRESTVRKVKVDDGETSVRETTDVVTGTESASLGALLSMGWQPTPAHDLGLFVLYSHQGDASAQRASGYSEADSSDARSSRLQFVTRELAFGQLRGTHRLGTTELRWLASLSHASREEPDTRDLAYLVLDDGRERFDAGPGSAERFFSDVDDLATNGSLSVGVPFAGGRFDVGASAQASFKDYSARRFRFDLVGKKPAVLFLPIEEMLSPEHIGEDFEIGEKTSASDGYEATAWVAAAFAAVDLSIGELAGWAKGSDGLRLLAGLRFEASGQVLDPGTRFAVTDDDPQATDRLDLDACPSASVVWSPTESMNVRLAYGWTLARPQTREIAPILYYDFVRRRSTSGNPDLRNTRIHNVDLRWEWFPEKDAVLAASVFYKHFEDPIERVIVSAANGNVSFANAESAWVAGGELEARASLGVFSPSLRPLRATANVTVLGSEVSLADAAVALQTSSTRALQGQAPYTVNLGLGWEPPDTGFELGLYYNVTGPRIAEVGFDGLPDVVEQPLHRLDLSASQSLPHGLKLKLAATNLAWQAPRLEADGVAVQETRPNLTASLSLEWTWAP